jgi:hypothetical protein
MPYKWSGVNELVLLYPGTCVTVVHIPDLLRHDLVFITIK